MRKSAPVISILIVHYKVKEELFECLSSIYRSKISVPFEIVVVDNDEEKVIEKELLKKFPQIKYIKNKENNGWGGGVNVASKYAVGEYLYFLNPDTKVFPQTIEKAYSFISKHPNAGVVSSLILDPKKNPHELQGTSTLTPLRAIIVYSFLNKIFPKNVITKKFFPFNPHKKQPQELEITTLTAAIVKKKIFEKVGKFDRRFFMYFEEFDFGNRIRKLGLQNYILPESKIIHNLGSSSQTRNDINAIFQKSRFLYFKKYYGLLTALLVEWFLRITKATMLLAVIFLLGGFFRFFRLSDLMPFIGDQAWFYISARDMLLTGHIPLVGIESSHTWLHQGALWTYLLATVLFISQYNPLSGAYLSVCIDLAAILLFYKVAKTLFSTRVGLVAAALYALSPLVILIARMPYHISPIPFFVLLFILFLYRWMKGSLYSFPLIIAILAVLYNLEIATFLLSAVVFSLLIYGFVTKQSWAKDLLRNKIILLSIVGFCVPMIPMLLYDTFHGFPQTFGFLAWMGYKGLVLFGYPPVNATSPTSWIELLSFYTEQLQRLFFIGNGFVAWSILLGSVIGFGFSLLRDIKNDVIPQNYLIILFLNVILIGGFVLSRTPSVAYLPMLFPGVFLLTALSLELLLSIKKMRFVAIFIISVWFVCNMYVLINNNYYIDAWKGYGTSYTQRFDAAQKIIKKANQRKYNLIGIGDGSQYKNYMLNYTYLTWRLGNPPVMGKTKVRITVFDTYKDVFVR